MEMMGIRDGFAAEVAFLSQARADYPELEMVRAPQVLDLHFATDFVARIGGVTTGVGLTLRQDLEKQAHDCGKAARKWANYVLVVLVEDTPLCRDEALAALVAHQLRGRFVLHTSALGTRVESGEIWVRPSHGERIRVEVYA